MDFQGRNSLEANVVSDLVHLGREVGTPKDMKVGMLISTMHICKKI